MVSTKFHQFYKVIGKKILADSRKKKKKKKFAGLPF